jgi:chromosome segregation ATPase
MPSPKGAAQPAGSFTAQGPQTMEALQERFAQLNKRKIVAETELQGAEKRLHELQQQAREQFGTDDVAELSQKLSELQRENESRRAAYQTQLDKIESDLAAVEAKFAAAASQPATAK